MSAFDASVNVVGTSIGVPTEEQIKEGAPSALEIAVRVGQQLPFSQGPGHPPVVADLGTFRFNFDRDTAIELFKKGLEAAEQLPSSSSTIQIAQSLDGVDEAAERMKAITGEE